MKTTTRLFTLVVADWLLTASGQATPITISTVPVGNPGNPADSRLINSSHPRHLSGVGAVGYSFNIGKTEITNAQYTAFLNAVAATDTYGLYNTSMDSETWGGITRSGSPGSFTYQVKAPALLGAYAYDNKPVVYVSSGDAMRFANWLHNGQPTGPQDASTTEDGAYTLNGAVTDKALAAVTRNAGARWWLPNEDEWYKAAYHKNDGVTGNYWDFPTRTSFPFVPNNNLPSSDTGNSANFWLFTFPTGSGAFPLTDAGAYTLSSSPYGTFDQGGNVWEWNETLFFDIFRGVRGGGWNGYSVSFGSNGLHFGQWLLLGGLPYPTEESPLIGFRVASVVEPASVYLAVTGIVTISLWRRARREREKVSGTVSLR